MRRKLCLLLTVIAIAVALARVPAPVKAAGVVNFYVYQPAGYVPGVDTVGEYIYQDKDNTRTVTVRDVRLTPVDFGRYPAGSTVATGDTDVGKSLYSIFKSAVFPYERHQENIAADALFNPGEYIYRDMDSNFLVSGGDVRLTAVPPYNPGSTVATGDADVGKTLVNFVYTAAPYERHQENVESNTFYDFAKVFVDIYIENDLPDYDPSSIVGYGVKVRVDPSVLIPYTWKGATTGYYLYDFTAEAGLPAPLLVGATAVDTTDVAEMIAPTPTFGAGDSFRTPAKLVSLIFIPLSATAWSPIDILFVDKDADGISDDWMSPDGKWHPATLIDGDYNVKPVPEFPLGIGLLLAIAPAIPIVYVWRTRKKVKTQ